MSGLDADLYGDLYGNDETDFNEQAQEEIPAESAPTDPAPRSPQHNDNNKSGGHQARRKQQQQHYTQPVQTRYTQPASQKIPRYEQPQPSENREPPAPRTDGLYQDIPVTGQSVRPSEMKDEG
ncbi:hypothetical protein K443DRAFT_686687, partial [Laccaria amethystina LaAM-08-1]